MDILPRDILGEIGSNCGHGTMVCLMYALSPFNTPIHKVDVDEAALSGCIGAVRWYMQSGYSVTPRTLECAASGGDIAMVELLISSGIQLSAGVLAIASSHGHLHLLQWLVNNKYVDEDRSTPRLSVMIVNSQVVHVQVCIASILSGHILILQWMYDRGYDMSSSDNLASALVPGNEAVVIWLLEHGCVWNIDFSMTASKYGFTDALALVHRIGLPIIFCCASVAARHGRLQTMKWLLSNTRQDTFNLSYNCLKGGGGECLSFCLEHGYVDNVANMYHKCVKYGLDSCISMLVSYGYLPSDPMLVSTAIFNGNLKLAQRLHREGCPFNYMMCYMSTINLPHDDRTQSLQWIRSVDK